MMTYSSTCTNCMHHLLVAWRHTWFSPFHYQYCKFQILFCLVKPCHFYFSFPSNFDIFVFSLIEYKKLVDLYKMEIIGDAKSLGGMFGCGIFAPEGFGCGLFFLEEFGCGMEIPREWTSVEIFVMRSLSSSSFLLIGFFYLCLFFL